MSPEARGRRAPRAGGDLNTRGEGRLRGALGGENKGGQRTQVGEETARRRGGRPSSCGSRRGHRLEAAAAPPTLTARTLSPPQGSCFPTRGGALKPGRGRPRSRLCAATPGGGGGQGKHGRAEGARERAARPRPPVWPPPSFPKRRALCSRPGAWARGGGGHGWGGRGSRAARGTYVSLWSSARRSLGTLRRWDSRLRRPSTVSSGGTDSS